MRTPHSSVIFSNHSRRFSNFLTPNLLAMEQLACRVAAGTAACTVVAPLERVAPPPTQQRGLPTQQRGHAQDVSRRPAGACATKILECASASRGHGQLPRDHVPVTACSSAVPCGYLPTLPRPKAMLLPLHACSLASAASLLLPRIRWSLAAPRRLRDHAAAPSAGCPAAAHRPSRPAQLPARLRRALPVPYATPLLPVRARAAAPSCAVGAPQLPMAPRAADLGRPRTRRSRRAARARESRSWTCGGGSEGVGVSVGGFAGLLLGWLGVE